MVAIVDEVKRDFAVVAHGVNGVFGQVFEHPAEQRGNQRHNQLALRQVDFELKFLGESFLQVVHRVADEVVDVSRLWHRHRADFREAVGDDLQPFDVFFHLVCAHEGLFLHFEQLDPAHQRREGGAQLVCCFLSHAGPHLVLL